MAPQPPIGVPYTASSDQPVSEWSASVHSELELWANERQGRWDWWSPGYLVLTIDSIGGEAIEPVVIHTWDEELTVELRHWDTHFPAWNSASMDDPAQIAAEARSVADDWLGGRFALAVYFAGDKWCGSKTVEAGEDHLPRLADIEWIKDFGPEQVEMRWADKIRFMQFTIANGQLVSP